MSFPVRAQVKGGRLVLDEPTDLPEGAVVELDLHQPGDQLDADERQVLHAELRASLAEARAGRVVDAEEVLAEIRSRLT